MLGTAPDAVADRPVAPTRTGSASVVDPFERTAQLVAHVVVVLIGLEIPITAGVSSPLLVAVGMAPMWLPVLRRYSLATAIAALAVVGAAWGIVLSELSSADHSVSATNRVQSIGLLLSGVAAFGLLLWCRQHLPVHRIAFLWGAGALLGTVAEGEMSWKYNLAVPTMFVAVGLIERDARWRRLAAVVLLALGVVGVLDEGRSLFALAFLAFVLVVSRTVSTSTARRFGRWSPAVLLAAVGIALYLLGTALLTGGYLGSTLEERSTQQVETAGSLISGGRPEWAATVQLFKTRPEGFGPGVAPSWSDYMAGKSGLSSINVDTGGYAKHYLFGGQFRLHSVAADLWVSYGFFGVALGATILVSLVRTLSFSLAGGTAQTAVVFACLLALWYLLFGPIYSNWLDVCFALGLTMLPRSSAAAAPQSAPGAAREPTPSAGPDAAAVIQRSATMR